MGVEVGVLLVHAGCRVTVSKAGMVVPQQVTGRYGGATAGHCQ